MVVTGNDGKVSLISAPFAGNFASFASPICHRLSLSFVFLEIRVSFRFFSEGKLISVSWQGANG